MIIHDLKSLPEYFGAVWHGSKTFEIRKNDRNFQEGDVLILKEWAEKPGLPWEMLGRHEERLEFAHTGQIVIARVTYVTNFEQKEGYVVLGLEIVEKRDLNHIEIPCRVEPLPDRRNGERRS